MISGGEEREREREREREKFTKSLFVVYTYIRCTDLGF